MLRTEIPFPLNNRLARFAAFVLGEAFLGFLAIIAVALTLFQMWFPLTPAGNTFVGLSQWGIIGVFAVEFLVALGFAPRRSQFLLNPWRIVDFATVVIPLLTLIPGVTSALRSSPVLRLVRLIRLATLGLRVSGVVVRERARQIQAEEATGPVEVCVLQAGSAQSTDSSWQEFLSWVKSPGQESKWFNVSNLGRAELHTIATTAGMPAAFLESHLLNATYPHLEVEQHYAALFAWLVEDPLYSPAQRNGLLLLVSSKGLVTLTRHDTDLPKLIAASRAEPELAKASFPVRMACSILQRIMEQNEALAARFDRDLGVFEELPLRESRPIFFERTFRLKKELSAAQSDLWRLKGVLNELAEGRVKLPGSNSGEMEFLRRLSRDVEYLYDTIMNTREALLSLIDLHLNIVSFDMNRVMRVLAVVSVLGLIPAVVGGLFGMNLIDNPWPWTLKQVAFCVCFGMTVCLYLFFVKGWLR